MEVLTVRELAAASTGSILEGYRNEGEFSGISTDSRTIKSGELFIPIVGDKHDGHDFIKDALAGGAGGSLLAEDKVIPPGYTDRAFIRVADTTRALGAIAAAYRHKFEVIVVGVTGSNGKTTSKEMIASVLAEQFKVHKSASNLNTEIGLPLSLFELESSHQVSVLEMGMNRQGDIAHLGRIAKPTLGVITNIGEAHIGYLRNRRNIATTKWELADSLPREGVLVLNADDPYLWEFRKKAHCSVKTFGIINPKADIRSTLPDEVSDSIRFALNDEDIGFQITALGNYNVYNALAAIAVGRALGLDYNAIKLGLERYRPLSKRMEISMVGSITIVNDSYNANPTSVKESLNWLANYVGGRKIVLLGDMLELGDLSARYHREVGEEAALKGLDIVAAVGSFSKDVKDGAAAAGMKDDRIFTFTGKTALAEWIGETLRDEDVLLVKGSRGMEMESVISELVEKFTANLSST